MLPLELFRIRNFSAGNLATVSIYGGLSIATFLLALAVQQLGGYSAFQAGMALLPVTILMFLLSPRFGALAGKFGPRLFMTCGPIIAAVGFVLLSYLPARMDYLTHLLPGIFLFGLGLSVTVAPLTSAVLGSIDSQRAGIASAVNNAVARIAGLLAVAMLGLVTGSVLTLGGVHRGTLCVAGLLFAGGVISWFGIRNDQLKKEEGNR
jgi:predicted MFS family arabinose efflux permease